MIVILQRVSEASVTVEGECVARCDKGFLLLLGVAEGDEEKDAELLADKIAKLRVFEDEGGKMNLSVTDVGGKILVVPNFTLLAAYRKGNRPDFMNSARPEEAERLFRYFCDLMEERVPGVTRGIFGAHMHVSLLNDGPLTIPMDSAVLRAPKRAK
jgi:D-tyrosyl-tRNA(Tyr) deacylase